jgi:hypothetical protein
MIKPFRTLTHTGGVSTEKMLAAEVVADRISSWSCLVRVHARYL